MSILIKGMRIPKPGNHEAIISVDEKRNITLYVKAPFPIRALYPYDVVEVPAPHGDLIDRDHLLSLIEGWNEDVENDKQNENSFVVGKTLNGVIRIIRGAHAFIEVEEEQ